MESEFGASPPSKPTPHVDALGLWWACWTCLWTAVLASGMAFLIRKRRTPMMRMRGLGLSLTAITLLHLYWISGQLVYLFGAMAPADAEYWVMGTYFPFCIALFHASNARFLHVAKRQQQFAPMEKSAAGLKPPLPPPPKASGAGVVGRFRRLDYTAKMVVLVASGMLFQLFLTVLMYSISRKFHASFGIPGTHVEGTEEDRNAAMSRGWEWWPTCLWQLVWAWVIAPVILWKSRNIKDTHGWRLQTIGCTLANLHATPMWMIALYVPAMEGVNQYFLPPQWICLSIFLMEIFTVFVPCWEVLRYQSLQKETLDSIAQWESKKRAGVSKDGKSLLSSGDSSTVVDSVLTGKRSAVSSVASRSSESIMSMSALEYVLERNPAPLQHYSALRDFSGENIAFLTSVSEWRNSFPRSVRTAAQYPHGDDAHLRALVLERFHRALRIYAQFVSVRDAPFPINISSPQQKALEAVFEGPTRLLYGEKRVPGVADWDSASEPPASATGSASETGSAEDRVQYWGEVPDGFNETIFDDAEKSIKYLVLTNTWPKFVRERRASNPSDEDAETGGVMQSRQ
ncbi:Regulator of G signaling superfamily [Cordyceps militaris]|uniref:Regulator of G signaling superfamily n=1 Tax=Cordyceps militaris TaxID=73501 RepID=A0A2H4S624_CORMI|nr:Regulator of G signaling superfamily [Cordyceps militaris]